ncbi:glycoprotein-N-acetylgalactosamine 3-beta-galactosyltransferase 1-like [Ylistrum balloti]|uniref:glycoprotein-N-acetylgalactosamine 3-beta-galactosyltransferase 1-like n=1 Tax=Ylistrum balloti TaxID=509963 RepID=UPI002905F32D|nr:glycoprotein-N-acetylgalactosamine 3-beta-galactosyltransferase 1-like [Ylistrum balloti]
MNRVIRLRKSILSLTSIIVVGLYFMYLPKSIIIEKTDRHVISAPVHVSPNRSQTIAMSTPMSGGRLLCWIMTSPITVVSKATHVQNTWGKRCDKLLFVSSNGTQERAKHLPVVELPVKEGRQNLWKKTKEALLHIYSSYLNDYDWFLKADDDTYVIVENLRHFLRDKDRNEAIYYGRRFKPHVKQGFMSGGAGYVLSRQAVRYHVEFGNSSNYLNSTCANQNNGEDVQLGLCLELAGVKAGDTRDSEGKERFFPLGPEDHMNQPDIKENNWYLYYSYYPHIKGCSQTVISFHYIEPRMMYILDYFVYNVTLPVVWRHA